MSLTLGFFGKLQEYPDFIKSEDFPESVQEFRAWFNGAFDYLTKQTGDDFKSVYDSLPHLQMIVKMPDSDSTVVSLAMPSEDASHRSSPFCIFAEAEPEQYRQRLCLMPNAYWLFFQIGRRRFEAAESFFAFQRQRDTLWVLSEGLPRSLTESSERCSAFLRRTSLRDFSELLDPSQGVAGAIKLLQTIFIALSPVRATAVRGFQAILRFPLSANPEEHSMQMAFWVMFTEAVLGNRAEEEVLLWTDHHFDIAFNCLHERLLSLSWLPDRDSDNLWPFASMTIDNSILDADLYRKFEALLENEELKLAEFIAGVRDILVGK
jgi:type VI secretion system ImpM family protein